MANKNIKLQDINKNTLYPYTKTSLLVNEDGTNAEIEERLSTATDTLASHTASTENPHGVTATQVGLGNVNNTSDADKPISTATQSALDSKADKTGTYNEMSVGEATHAVTADVAKKVDTDDFVSYPGTFISRVTAGGNPIKDEGAVVNSLKGNTVKANQLAVKCSDNENINNLTFEVIKDEGPGYIKINGKASATTVILATELPGNAKLNHIYLTTTIVQEKSGVYARNPNVEHTTDNGDGVVFKLTFDTGWMKTQVVINSGTELHDYLIKPRIADLTYWFGVTEVSQVTAVMKDFVIKYLNEHPKFVGLEMISCNPQSITSFGNNLHNQIFEIGSMDAKGINFDNRNCVRSKDLIKVIPNKELYIKIFAYDKINYQLLQIVQYDFEHNVTSYTGVFQTNEAKIKLKSNTYYIRFFFDPGLGEIKDISSVKSVVSFYNYAEYKDYSNQNTISTLYEKYFTREVDMWDETQQKFIKQKITGMFGINNVHDELLKDKAIRRFGIVNLGTLEWIVLGAGGSNERIQSNQLSGIVKFTRHSEFANTLSTIYKTSTADNVYLHSEDNLISVNGSDLAIYSSLLVGKSISEIKQALSGTMLIYEFETPEIIDISPENQLQYNAYNNGIEEISGDVPVTADIEYGDDFEAKVKGLPTGPQINEALDKKAEKVGTYSNLTAGKVEHKITFTGAATGTFDGSADLTINVSGGGIGPGQKGDPGKSAYEVAVDNGFVGSEAEWLASLKGTPGKDGTNGQDGKDGAAGKSAYEIAKDLGKPHTESEDAWITSLKGEPGKDGTNGTNGTNGQDGKPGEVGPAGPAGAAGKDGKDGINGCIVEVVGKLVKFTQPKVVKDVKVVDNPDGTVDLEIN